MGWIAGRVASWRHSRRLRGYQVLGEEDSYDLFLELYQGWCTRRREACGLTDGATTDWTRNQRGLLHEMSRCVAPTQVAGLVGEVTLLTLHAHRQRPWRCAWTLAAEEALESMFRRCGLDADEAHAQLALAHEMTRNAMMGRLAKENDLLETREEAGVFEVLLQLPAQSAAEVYQ